MRIYPISFLFVLFFASKTQASFNVGVASKSPVKVEAVKLALEAYFASLPNKREFRIHAFEAKSDIAEQPVGEANGFLGARNRLVHAKSQTTETMDLWVSIESFVEPSPIARFIWQDVAAVIIEVTPLSLELMGLSRATLFPESFAAVAEVRSKATDETGYSVTIGEVLSDSFGKAGVQMHANDWQAHSVFGGRSRVKLIQETIDDLLSDLDCEEWLSKSSE